MKILFLNTDIGYGGATKMIAWLANRCASSGHDVTFLTYRENEVRQPMDAKVKLVHRQLESLNHRANSIMTVKWIHRFIKKNRFDLGIAFLSPSILRMALAAKGTYMKTLFSYRADPFYVTPHMGLKSKLINLLNSWAFGQADRYVFQTEMAQSYFTETIRSRSVVISNPIKPLQRTMAREGNVRNSFIVVARLDLKQKRQDLAIEAFNIISPMFPNYKLEIYGDGEDEYEIRRLASSNPNILLMGRTYNVASVVQNALALVLSSDFEGIPNILLEAMSLAVPCISTDCSPGGAAMLIQNKKNGILVPRGDVQALAEAMKYIIVNREDAEIMGEAGTDVELRYAEDVISHQWLSLIGSMQYK